MKSFVQEEEGVTAIEYGLLAALIAVAIIAAVIIVGQQLDLVFGRIGHELTDAVGEGGES